MIILASGSPRRQQLLNEWKIKFRLYVPKIREISHYKRPHLLVQDIARKKVVKAKKKYPGKIILAADTIVVLKERQKDIIIGKPRSILEAEKILRKLSGTVHRVYTGVAAISPTGKIYTAYALSRLKLRKIPNYLIKKLSRKHLDKAGAYAVQEKNDFLVEKIWGDYYNVVGLPFKETRKVLKLAGFY